MNTSICLPHGTPASSAPRERHTTPCSTRVSTRFLALSPVRTSFFGTTYGSNPHEMTNPSTDSLFLPRTKCLGPGPTPSRKRHAVRSSRPRSHAHNQRVRCPPITISGGRRHAPPIRVLPLVESSALQKTVPVRRRPLIVSRSSSALRSTANGPPAPQRTSARANPHRSGFPGPPPSAASGFCLHLFHLRPSAAETAPRTARRNDVLFLAEPPRLLSFSPKNSPPTARAAFFLLASAQPGFGLLQLSPRPAGSPPGARRPGSQLSLSFRPPPSASARLALCASSAFLREVPDPGNSGCPFRHPDRRPSRITADHGPALARADRDCSRFPRLDDPRPRRCTNGPKRRRPPAAPPAATAGHGLVAPPRTERRSQTPPPPAPRPGSKYFPNHESTLAKIRITKLEMDESMTNDEARNAGFSPRMVGRARRFSSNAASNLLGADVA